jgi:hypothetical protein
MDLNPRNENELIEPEPGEPSSTVSAWVHGVEARRVLGVSTWMWDKWLKQGAIPKGKPVGRTRVRLYPLEELRRTIEALRAPQPFPPPGMVDGEAARQMFDVGTWTWDKWRREGNLRCSRWVERPGGGRAKLYPVEELRRVVEELKQFPPPGMVTGDEAAKMFGVSRMTWKGWVVQRRVCCGKPFANPGGGMCYLYAVEDLERLLKELRGPDKAYWDPQNPGFYRVPPGYVRQREAWRMFGVDRGTWKRWEREKQITCGKRVNAGGPKLYKLDDLNRLLEEYGRYAPPYPDPQQPGVYRVPLSGNDIRRREAIIDAADLPLVEGRRWGWIAPREAGGFGHVAMSHSGETTALHRIILGITDPEATVMHVNDDPLDCRRENLVVRTHSEKMAAARKMRTFRGRPCTSRFKGVCWDEKRGKWVAQIKASGRHRLIGRFDDEIAAAQARDEAAREAWGEHARLNFPDGVDAWLGEQAARRAAA